MPDIEYILEAMNCKRNIAMANDIKFDEGNYVWILGADVFNVLEGMADYITNVPITDSHRRAECKIFGISAEVSYVHRTRISLCKEV